MSYPHHPLHSASALLLVMALTACGGGGGGGGGGGTAGPGSGIGSAAPAPAQPAASAAAPALPPPVPGTTPDPLPGGSAGCTPGDAPQTRSSAFVLINMTRLALGLPELTRLAALDATAQSHAQYAVANDSSGVAESYGMPCFTGVDLAQRLAAAGVVPIDLPGQRQRSEIVVGYTASGSVEPQSWDYVNDTINNLYGRVFLFDPRMRQVGLGFSTEPGAGRRAMVLDTALLSGAADASGDVWAAWPRDGATGLPAQMRPSNIKPLAAELVEGYPVTLHASAAVQVTRFALSTASSGAPVEATALTSANDGNGLLTATEAALVPHAPLAAGTSYRAEFDGSVGATPVHLVWTFTTAP